MRKLFSRAVRRLVGTKPRRSLCGCERRQIITMIDAGLSHATIVRWHGFTPAEIDRAIAEQTNSGRTSRGTDPRRACPSDPSALSGADHYQTELPAARRPGTSWRQGRHL